MTITIDAELVARLMEGALCSTLADRQKKNEDLLVVDYAGSNVDDAYQMGYDDGVTDLARQILDAAGIIYEKD